MAESTSQSYTYKFSRIYASSTSTCNEQNSQITFSLVLSFSFLIFTKHDLLFYFFSQPLLETFFCLFDRDSSGLLSESEWIGSVYKVTEYVYMISSFILSQQTFDHLSTCIYIYLFTGYPIVQKMFERLNHSYVLFDIFPVD